MSSQTCEGRWRCTQSRSLDGSHISIKLGWGGGGGVMKNLELDSTTPVTTSALSTAESIRNALLQTHQTVHLSYADQSGVSGSSLPNTSFTHIPLEEGEKQSMLFSADKKIYIYSIYTQISVRGVSG